MARTRKHAQPQAVVLSRRLGHGLAVIIDHNNGWASHYANLQAGVAILYRSRAQYVCAGDPIGYVGAHEPEAFKRLYFELRERDTDRIFAPVDPRPHLGTSNLRNTTTRSRSPTHGQVGGGVAMSEILPTHAGLSQQSGVNLDGAPVRRDDLEAGRPSRRTSTAEAACYLRCQSASAIRNLKQRGALVPVGRSGRADLYLRTDLDQFVRRARSVTMNGGRPDAPGNGHAHELERRLFAN